MSIYTVHEPPLRARSAAPEPEQCVFVRDGFSFWAFVFGPLWMLCHRMWLVLLIYIVSFVVLEGLVVLLGAPDIVAAATGFVVSLWVGFEAATLRRFTLHRRGFGDVGVISGGSREAAERRFFEAWLQQGSQTPTPQVLALHTLTAAPPATSGGVIGLFPESGAHR